MANSKRSGKGWDVAYSAYKVADRAAKNTTARKARHLKAHPEDKQAADKVVSGYTRMAPKNKQGWVTGKIQAAMGAWLSVGTEPVQAPRTKAAQKRLAQHMSFEKACNNERVYTQRKNSNPLGAKGLAKAKRQA